jgi:hypothetical protein
MAAAKGQLTPRRPLFWELAVAKTLREKIREKISDEPIAVASLFLALLAFLVPIGRDKYKQWEASKPKFNLKCQALSGTSRRMRSTNC